MYAASLIVAVLAFALAALWAVVGVAGLLQKFPGNRWVGVRTPETIRSEQAWILAHRVAAPGFLGGAVAAALGGALALVNSWGFLYALGGLILGLLAISVVSGVAVRAAEAVAEPVESGGCSSGCCSPAAETDETGLDDEGAAAAAADCGQSSCGSCALSGMCLPESQAGSSSAP
ncbi:SdpI family protein [Gordonia phosphorivorans]|uniref:SdpI family protein n=1 Tax=Gordonia phosphorivorans TaxID=1056982 RepID=A0ABV6HB14_9ACTN